MEQVFFIQEYSASFGKWYTICQADNKEIAQRELRHLINRNGNNYRVIKIENK